MTTMEMAPTGASGGCQQENRNGESLFDQENSTVGAPRQGRTPRVRIDRPLLGRSTRLLNMLYRPSELAEELKVDVQVIYRQWVPAGLPHSRAGEGHLWINGREARDWLARQRRTGQGPKLQDHEAYCVRCRRAVPFEMLERVKRQSGVDEIRGMCSICGARIWKRTKAVSDGQP